MGRVKNQIDDEYEELFPYDDDFADWVDAMEADYATIEVPSNAKFVYVTEEYSPYATINS